MTVVDECMLCPFLQLKKEMYKVLIATISFVLTNTSLFVCIAHPHIASGTTLNWTILHCNEILPYKFAKLTLIKLRNTLETSDVNNLLVVSLLVLPPPPPFWCTPCWLLEHASVHSRGLSSVIFWSYVCAALPSFKLLLKSRDCSNPCRLLGSFAAL